MRGAVYGALRSAQGAPKAECLGEREKRAEHCQRKGDGRIPEHLRQYSCVPNQDGDRNRYFQHGEDKTALKPVVFPPQGAKSPK